jgi:hypothetical protein
VRSVPDLLSAIRNAERAVIVLGTGEGNERHVAAEQPAYDGRPLRAIGPDVGVDILYHTERDVFATDYVQAD